ncbi:MAG: HEAT repeat domain-containing protein [Candidatus Heimdallarchaeota archaeon]|nr:HEAT repeat domain-containing protein [Candidatus Heimdallarchaeota archaeon]
MADVADLLEQAQDADKKQRKNAVKELGNLDVQYESVMDTLRDLAANDSDKGVRKEADKSIQALSSKPLEGASITKEVEIDDDSSEYSLQEGEYDVDSSMDKREEDRLEMQAEGKGLMVSLQEKNYVTMDYYGEVQSTDQSSGSIVVANSGSKDRITGVDLELKNINNIQSETELSDKTNIGLLKPGMDNAWKVDYKFEAAITPIKIEQSYADPETGTSPNFASGAEQSFEAQIVVTNTTDSAIYNLKGEKTVNELASLSGSNSTKGNVNANANVIEFVIDELAAGESATVTLQLTASLPEDEPSYKSGELKVTYENKDTLGSGLDFDSVDGVSTIRQRVKRTQRETEPGFYDCQIVFQNLSEFVYDLNKFEVFAGDIESSELVLSWDGTAVSEDEREIVPGESVDYKFVFESPEGSPSFGEHVEFSVQHEIVKSALTQILLPVEDLKFMALDIAKAFMVDGEEINKFEIPSYVETEIPTMLTVTGVGSYPLEGIIITDEIAAGFRGPMEDQVVLSRGSEDVPSGEYNLSVSDNELRIELEHLEESPAGGFKEGDQFIIKYVQIADKLGALEEKIATKSSAEGYIYSAADARVIATTENDDLELVVLHVRDDLDIGKVVESIDYEGSDAFRISLEADNMGSSTVSLFLEDLIPNGFRFLEETLESQPEAERMDPKSHGDGTIYGLKFNNISPDSNVRASFVVIEEDSTADPRKLQAVFRG